MARTWGARSAKVYDELDPRLQRVCDRVLHEVADISLLCGHRGYDEQEDMVELGRSHLHFPHSKHNTRPSLAVDLQPYPNPRDKAKLWASLGYIAGSARQIAAEEGFTIRWGGDWNQNGDITDQNFYDLFHLEVFETPAERNARLERVHPANR